MLDYTFLLSLFRENPIDWSKNLIYKDIACDIQINQYKKYASWNNSDFSEMADYFVFVKKEFNDVQIWDIIEFENNFWEKEVLIVQSRDFINYESVEPFIEILAKLK